MALLKKSTVRNRAFLMVSNTDHITGKTGAGPAVTLSKDGSAFAAAGGAITELTNGWYVIAYTTTDSDTLGDLAVHITGTGADPTDFVDQVVLDLPGASVASVVAGGLSQTDLNKVFGSSAATIPELAQATPPSTPTPAQAMMLLYQALRNLSTTTATTYTVTNTAGTVICKSALTDDGTTFSRAQMVSGP